MDLDRGAGARGLSGAAAAAAAAAAGAAAVVCPLLTKVPNLGKPL